jgi:hypothetical protein
MEMGKKRYLNTAMSFSGEGNFSDAALQANPRWSNPYGNYENDQLRLSVSNVVTSPAVWFYQTPFLGYRYIGSYYAFSSEIPSLSDAELNANTALWSVLPPFHATWLNDQIYTFPNNDFALVP